MAYDRDRTRVGPRRASRLGGRASRFRPRQGAVLALNAGSSPHGRRSTLPLNRQGGTFGAGRPAGGGIAAALVARGPSVVGAPVVGPPPAPPSPPAPVFTPVLPSRPRLPVFEPAPVEPHVPPPAPFPASLTSTTDLFQQDTRFRGRYPRFLAF